MLSVHRTQSIPVLFSPPVIYHNLQVTNSTGTRKKLMNLTSFTSSNDNIIVLFFNIIVRVR